MGFMPFSVEITEAEERLGKRDAFLLLIGVQKGLH
jgi:hypothetical protein